jgi:hypothetical protein
VEAMTIEQTITFIDHELKETLQEYETWFLLEDEVRNYKPQQGWSIEQILEHVTLKNHFLLILIRKGKKKALDLSFKQDWKQLTETYQYHLNELEAIAMHQSFEWIRPEHMEPTGDKDTSQIRSLLKEQVTESGDILNELRNGEGLLYKTTMSVNNLGKIDVYQYIYFLCQHAKRHVTQMQKVKEEYNISAK